MICSLQWPNDMVQYASRSVNFWSLMHLPLIYGKLLAVLGCGGWFWAEGSRFHPGTRCTKVASQAC